MTKKQSKKYNNRQQKKQSSTWKQASAEENRKREDQLWEIIEIKKKCLGKRFFEAFQADHGAENELAFFFFFFFVEYPLQKLSQSSK